MTEPETEKPAIADDIPTPEDLSSEVLAAGADSEEGQIAALEAEMAQMKDQMLRALAEVDNIRKRSIKEREDAGKYAVTAFARDMLEIADNFQRAIDAVPAEAREADPALKNLMDGIEATERVMVKYLEKHGIIRMEPMDGPFDPNFHEVMFEAPVPGKPGGTVIQVLEPGYTIADRLLRPAKVGVAKADESGGTPHKIDETA